MKIAAPQTAAVAAPQTSHMTKPTASIVEGGCFPNRGPKDRFEPIPRCPPGPGPIKPPGGLEMALYKAKLRGMSDKELSAEKSRQQRTLAVAQLTGNDKAAQAAQAKLNAIRAEQFRRLLDDVKIPHLPHLPGRPVLF